MTDTAGIAWLNGLDGEAAGTALLACCGSRAWVAAMVARRPFASASELLAAGDDAWNALGEHDRLEAFAAHPRIGESDGRQPGRGAAWSTTEQSAMQDASAWTRTSLAEGNRLYEERFGWTYIVCATGRTAGEMLGLLHARMSNAPEHELRVAAEEQRQITRLRLGKLIAEMKAPRA